MSTVVNEHLPEMYDGRKGFIHSAFHGVVSGQQDTDESFITDKKKQLYFNYIVRDADFTGDKTSLTVKVWSNGNQVFSDVYNSTNLPLVTTKSVLGGMYEIIYSTQGASTKGFRIDFSTTSTVYVAGTSTSSSQPTFSTPGKQETTSFSSTKESFPTASTKISSQNTTQATSIYIASSTTPDSLRTTTKTAASNNFVFVLACFVSYILFK